jgi:hypothetical protein
MFFLFPINCNKHTVGALLPLLPHAPLTPLHTRTDWRYAEVLMQAENSLMIRQEVLSGSGWIIKRDFVSQTSRQAGTTFMETKWIHPCYTIYSILQ